MTRHAVLCALLLAAAPAFAEPKCDDALARLKSADGRVLTVERYGGGSYWEQTGRGRVAHYVHVWETNDAGVIRYIIYTEMPGASGPHWGSLATARELKAKVAWRSLDGVPLDETFRITGGPLEGEWTLICQGRPPKFVKLPRFADYPATERPWRGPVKRPTLSRRIDENVRMRFNDAFEPDAKPNAAARYLRLTWTCGTACVGGALVHAPTGRVIWLPYMAGWGDVTDAFEPIDTRLTSRLVVLSGIRNEGGLFGRHFYLLEGGRLRHLRSVETQRDFPQKVE